MSLIGSKKFEQLSEEIFQINNNIKYFALIDLEGHILVENSKDSTSFVETDAEKILFYHQMGTRRSKREDYDDICGETSYVHIQRKKNQQLVVYLPLVTLYLMIDNKVQPSELAVIAKNIQKINKEKLNHVLNSILMHGNF
ncbi:hypothetical protein LCGC14_3159340 [marine sediment metagenome]|uniref:Roadblock/LAMTOR2 domain-containing protein n=1 Tax=marine sediment metagenome TaxID=412755 RepID=A0A0F8VRU0_9ZZZZ